MSREEITCAKRLGEGYRLYRVLDITSASPQVYVFGNPYTLWQEGKALFELRDTTVVLAGPRTTDVDA